MNPASLPRPVSADGPYSLCLRNDGPLLFISGQGPWNPETGSYERGSIARQTELTLETIKAIAERAGARLEDAVRCRVFLQPLTRETFEEMNAVYARYFPGERRPVRTTVGAGLLDIDVEIDCVIGLKEPSPSAVPSPGSL
ncbi:MAG TPA: RidA family protein [Chthoniobacteraceae bacterium]|nr:RidA family protein [Chthoniobacteraceae bacterium]